VHNEVPSTKALFPYLPPYWVEHVQNTMFKGPTEFYYPPGSPIAAVPGSRPTGQAGDGPTGARPGAGQPSVIPAGADLDLLRSQVLVDVELAIMCSPYPVDSLHNPDAAIAFARAFNEWQIAEWLDKDSRLRASIVVPIQLPEEARKEIDRVGNHPGFVQVALPVRTDRPLGSRLYHPVWEAIARHNLVAGIQFGGVPGNPPTPSGWPSYFYEEYVGAALTFFGFMHGEAIGIGQTPVVAVSYLAVAVVFVACAKFLVPEEAEAQPAPVVLEHEAAPGE